MKRFLLSVLLIGLAAGAFAQGQINLDNLSNTDNSPTATSNGKFFFCTGSNPYLANLDFNIAFYGGSDANSLVLLRSFSGASSIGGNAFGAGTFVDPLGIAATIPGAATTAFFRIEAWTGMSSTFAGAGPTDLRNADSAYKVFSNPISTPPNTPPSLVNMPAIVMGYLNVFPSPVRSLWLALEALGC